MQRVGIIGGGQLAQMLTQAAHALGLEVWAQTPHDQDPVVGVADHVIFAELDDLGATRHLANRVDVVTFENEFVNADRLQILADQGVFFRPHLGSLRPLLDKLYQRQLLKKLGIPTPRFWSVQGSQALEWLGSLPWDPTPEQPLVLKIRRGGYDGQGTFILKSKEQILPQLKQIEHHYQGSPDLLEDLLLVEEWIPFQQELALVAARSSDGQVSCFPLVETEQVDQVCRRVLVPARPDITQRAQAVAITLLNHLNWVGLMGIEFFWTADQQLLVNEIAPRTHNSGHYTLEACQTSQFEQHLRAITDRPLGDASLITPAAIMVNLLGEQTGSTDAYAEPLWRLSRIPDAHLHWYGKTESRLGRKMGHVTVVSDSDNRDHLLELAHTVEEIWYQP